MQLNISKGSWAVKTTEEGFCFRYRLISVLKASIAIIQKLQNETLSRDIFFIFLRYTDNEAKEHFKHYKLNMTL